MLKIENYSKSYTKDKKAVDGLSLEVKAGDLFAFIGVLDKVPVLRWVAEADPEQPLTADARSFDHGNALHGGFLRWNQDHFEVSRTVPAGLWPCDDSPLLPCQGDPFVTGR